MSERNKILEVNRLKVHFDYKNHFLVPKSRRRYIKAVDGVNLELFEGETLGIVGESGCGKSTLARGILKLVEPSDGQIIWMGEDITKLSVREMRKKRKEMQIIFQDPLASLDPRMTIGNSIAEPLVTHFPKLKKQEVKERVKSIMSKVGLLPNLINRYPHEFSGGQCQRIGIARALIVNPKLIICDEAVSALDVSIQAQVINLLKDLQKELNLTLIFISHDLSVVKHISDRILVMYLGRAVELADYNDIYDNARHPYTKALLSAVPIPDPELERSKSVQFLEGDLPSPISPPGGCVFHTRCPQAIKRCQIEVPQLFGSNKHQSACILDAAGMAPLT